jgi:hypothetical protein
MQGIMDSGGTTASGSRSTSEQEEERVFQEARRLWHNGVHADLKVQHALQAERKGSAN